MSLYTESELRSKTNREKIMFSKGLRGPIILSESSSLNKPFDIFLSHSYLDKDVIQGLKLVLEEYGYSIYVDWIEDKYLSREGVTKQTAEIIKARMKKCRALLYAVSLNSPDSKWMPWELGYFDGYKEKVAIFPIVTTTQNHFTGTEYLGIYPYVKKAENTKGVLHLWVHETLQKYIRFHEWMKGQNPLNR